MPSETSPILALPYIQPSQAQKHVTHNEALRTLDVLVQTVVEDRDRTAPPSDPAPGQSHIVAAPATADWAGQDHGIATFDGSLWAFTAPRPGWSAQVLAESARVGFDGAAWGVQGGSAPGAGTPETLGINATADATNRLTVAAPATLLTHEGAGHQLKLNKNAASETASLLFQNSFSGRAEMGTAGSDAFAIKVSGDGASWFTGLSLDPATGAASFPSGAVLDTPLGGQAVQQNPEDTTPGRLMRADYGFGPGNLLGPVALASGVPTGAVIERGTTANGDYVRFADGTQICVHTMDLSFLNGGKLTATWSYPAPFVTAAGLYLAGMINVSSFNSNVTGPAIDEVLDVRFGTVTSGSGLAQIMRIPGFTNFVAGDFVSCQLYAFGRWE